MTLPSLFVDTTQFLGVVLFAVAALACWGAAATRKAHSLWLAVGFIHALLAVELMVGLRYRIHDAVNTGLRAIGWYEGRSAVQVALLAVVVPAIGFWAWRAAVRHGLRKGSAEASSAVLGTCAAIAVFAVEAISLHAVDAAMNTMLGPVKLLALLWAPCAAVVVFSAAGVVRARH